MAQFTRQPVGAKPHPHPRDIGRFATMSDNHHPSSPGHATYSGRDGIAVAPAVPHIDEVTQTTPPWTVPEPYDEAAVSRSELVAPMESPCKLAEVSGTDAPRLVKKRDVKASEDEKP